MPRRRKRIKARKQQFPDEVRPPEGLFKRFYTAGLTRDERDEVKREIDAHSFRLLENLGYNAEYPFGPPIEIPDIQMLLRYNRWIIHNRRMGKMPISVIPIDTYLYIYRNSYVNVDMEHVITMSEADLSYGLKLDKYTIHRNLKVLCEKGLIKFDEFYFRRQDGRRVKRYIFANLKDWLKSQKQLGSPHRNYSFRARIAYKLKRSTLIGIKQEELRQMSKAAEAAQKQIDKIQSNPYLGLFINADGSFIGEGEIETHDLKEESSYYD